MNSKVNYVRRIVAAWLLGIGLAALIGGCLYGLIPRVGYAEISWCGSPWIPDNSEEQRYSGQGIMKDSDARSRALLRAECTLARRGGEVAAATAIAGFVLASFGGALLVLRKSADPAAVSSSHDGGSFLDKSMFLPPAGWLIDPDDAQRERWWTGAGWTEARRRAEK